MSATPAHAQPPPAQPAATSGRGGPPPHRWIIVGVLVALLVVGLFTYGYEKRSHEAQAKADQLVAALHAAGLPVPVGTDEIVRVLGHDGGPVCDDPGGALRKALLDAQLVNGAAFVGMRPIRAAVNVVRGETLILQIYCPQKLAEFRDRVNDYKVDTTVRR